MVVKEANTLGAASLVTKLTIEAPRIHIYPFSKLIGAPAAKWEKLISELEEKERIVYLYYQPVREAIVSSLRDPGHTVMKFMRRRLDERSRSFIPHNKTL